MPFPPRCPRCPRSLAPAAKKEGDQLFECFDAQDLNVRLKDLMEGLSVKVGGPPTSGRAPESADVGPVHAAALPMRRPY